MLDDHPFALCLTHDVDRPFKRPHQGVYFAVRRRSPRHLRAVRPGHNPYWTFGDIASLEESLGVRSAFYFLQEPSLTSKGPSAWIDPDEWVETLGRYRLDSDRMRRLIEDLDAGGWEVGLHGSRASYDDPDRLAREKETLEGIVGGSVAGVRQHHLRLAGTDTWEHQRATGLAYDASLGSSRTFGFQYGDRPFRPFDDEFTVFPLTVMECTLPDPGESFETAWDACETLVEEAATRGAVATVLWHSRFLSARDFPGYRRLYRRLIEHALDRGGWVGPPGALYDRIDPADLRSLDGSDVGYRADRDTDTPPRAPT